MVTRRAEPKLSLLALLVLSAAHSTAQQIVAQYPATSQAAKLQVGDRLMGARVTLRVPDIRLVRLNPGPLGAHRLTDALRKSGLFLKVWADSRCRALDVPNDQFWNLQWGPTSIGVDRAWDLQKGHPSTIVAVLDSGIAPNHADLQNFVPKWDYVDGDATPWDLHGHGTHVAGTISATVNNGIGVAGVARNCSLHIYRVLNENNLGWWSDISAAIVDSANQGAHVVNMSLGGPDDPGIESACDYASSRGVILVAAAGNDNTSAPLYPAYYNTCLAVGSITSTRARSSFSNYGSWVDVAGPGSNVYSTLMTGNYGYYSGTSMASPHVAGVAALAYSNYAPERSFEIGRRVRGFIETTARDVPGRWCYFGIVDARNLVGVTRQLPVQRREYSDPPFEFKLTSVAAAGADTYFAAGYSSDLVNNRASVFIGKYAADGTLLWSYGFPWASSWEVRAVASDGRGGAFAVGMRDFRFVVYHVSAGGASGNFIVRGDAGGVSEANGLSVSGGRAAVVGGVWDAGAQMRRAFVLHCGPSLTNAVQNFVEPFNNTYSESVAVRHIGVDGSFLILSQVDDLSFGKYASLKSFRASPQGGVTEQWAAPPIVRTEPDIRAIDLFTSPSGTFGLACATGPISGNNWYPILGRGSYNSGTGFQLTTLRYPQWLVPAAKIGTVRTTAFGKDGMLMTASAENQLRSNGYVLAARFGQGLAFSSDWADQGHGTGVRMLSGSKFADATACRAVVTPEGKTFVTGSAYDLGINSGSTHATLWQVSNAGDWDGHHISFRRGSYEDMVLTSSGLLVCVERVAEGGNVSLNAVQVHPRPPFELIETVTD